MFAEKRDWQALCEAASKEKDPGKLRDLITELLKALDERKAASDGWTEPQV
jgi:hypothetical protein